MDKHYSSGGTLTGKHTHTLAIDTLGGGGFALGTVNSRIGGAVHHYIRGVGVEHGCNRLARGYIHIPMRSKHKDVLTPTGHGTELHTQLTIGTRNYNSCHKIPFFRNVKLKKVC
jgi:hypothetical protein